MPDKPLWLGQLDRAIHDLEGLSLPWVDRATVERILGVGRRRAQQLLAPVATIRIGTSAVALRRDLIAHLEKIASAGSAQHEARRRRKLWSEIGRWRQQWIEQPPVLVEVPPDILRRIRKEDVDGLPEGVDLAPGTITIRFSTPTEALEKLLALAMAVGRNQTAFEDRVGLPGVAGPARNLTV